MLTAHGPRVLEFNARWGDPETQVYLPRLENDLVEVFLACIDGTLHRHPLRWSPLHAVCVVLASHGYPGAVERGKVIHGLANVALLPQVKVFHAGTARLDGEVVTSGGRVLGVTAWDTSLHAARDRAYAAVDHLCFEGMQFRRDIAAKGLAVAPSV
jgi:phosphoribosylamine--glycine ligase